MFLKHWVSILSGVLLLTVESVQAGDFGAEFKFGAGAFSSTKTIGNGTSKNGKNFNVSLPNSGHIDMYAGAVWKMLSLGIELNVGLSNVKITDEYDANYPSGGNSMFVNGELTVHPFQIQTRIAGSKLEPYLSVGVGRCSINVSFMDGSTPETGAWGEKYTTYNDFNSLMIKGGLGVRMYGGEKLKGIFLYCGINEMHIAGSQNSWGVVKSFNNTSGVMGLGIDIRPFIAKD